MKRRKLKADRRENQVRVRLTDAQKDAFNEAAKRAGLDLSSWLRALGVKACEGDGK